MKRIVVVCAILLSGLFLVSCDSDGVEARNNTFQVDVAGKEFKATGALAYWTDFSDGSFNAYGIEGNLTIYVGFDRADITEGEYSISDDVYVYAVYDDGTSYATVVDGSSGKVSLIQKDAKTLKGTLDVEATNFDDENDKLNLSNGSFNVEYR